MKNSIDKIKFKELESILNSISIYQFTKQDYSKIDSCIKKLKDFYKDDYRHRYSDIYLILNSMRRENLESLEIINQNIAIIYEFVKNEDKYTDLKKPLEKLYDHITLDIARFNEFIQMEKANELIMKTSNKTREAIEKNNEEIESTKKEYVSILGIFASIVLAFVANMVFATSVLENIGKVNIYVLLLITTILGWFLINMLYMLINFIVIILDMKDTKFFNISKVNIVILIFLIILFIAWFIEIDKIKLSKLLSYLKHIKN